MKGRFDDKFYFQHLPIYHHIKPLNHRPSPEGEGARRADEGFPSSIAGIYLLNYFTMVAGLKQA